MGKAARDKGKRGELGACKLWQDAGYDAFRSVQHNGKSEKGEADIIIRGISGAFYPEVKNTEKFSIFPILKTAQREAGMLRTAFVMHTRNGQPFVVCLAAEDFISLVKKAGYEPPAAREIEL